MASYPPGPEGRFMVGNLPDFRRDRLGFLMQCQRGYGDIAHIRMFGRHLYLISRPELIHQVLVKDARKFGKSPMLKRNTEQVIGRGLLTSEGEFHKRQRQMIQPAFHLQRIAAYADVMVDYTLRLVDKWQDGAEYDMHEAMMALTMQIVAKTLFDADVAQDASDIGHAITVGLKTATDRITRVINIPEWIPTPMNHIRRDSRDLLERTIRGIISERRKTNEDKGDLLSMLLLSEDEDGSRMSDKQVRDEAMTLFIAGHETTANALSWALYLLSQYPDTMTRLQDEIETLLQGRAPSIEDYPKLRYAEMVVKEAMRLYPPAWILTRQALEDVELGGYTVAGGDIVMFSQYIMHRHPNYWEQPEQFIPERFEREDEFPKFIYFPFGGGPRICIGNHFAMLEAVLVLATLVQRAEFELLSGQTITPEPLITLRPSPAVMMRVTMQ